MGNQKRNSPSKKQKSALRFLFVLYDFLRKEKKKKET
jgi:hypothetical protein